MNALLHWLTAPEWSQVVKTLLHSLWQGALVAAALALIMRRLANPYARYRCSLVALAAIPVAGIITWAILNALNHQPLPAPLPIATEAATPLNLIPLNPSPVTRLIMFADHTPAPPPSHWTAWLALAWLIGTITMLGRAGVKVAGAERLRRACQPLDHPRIAQLVTEARRAVGLVRQIRVAITDKLTSPVVVGMMVPTLILPLSLVTTLTPEQIRFILLHELAHIRRGDYFANLFQLFVEALLFFNPVVWWISHQVRREREACCDALAIELSGAPADYARTLVHVAETVLSPTPASATAFGGDREPSSLADRIQRLLVPGYRPSLRLTWRAMIGAFVLGAALLVLSAEGTRVAVAQIAKSTQENEKSSVPHQLEGILSPDNSLLDPDHFTNQFNLGEPKDPLSIGPRIPAQIKFIRTHELDSLQQKLHAMRFQVVACSNKPLGELFRELSEQSEALDKDGVGFRFSVIPIRLRTIPATIDPPLTNASLSEILAAIQGAPQLRLNGVNTNGLVTLQTITSFATQNNSRSQSELEADQWETHEGDNRSAQTTPLSLDNPANANWAPDHTRSPLSNQDYFFTFSPSKTNSAQATVRQSAAGNSTNLALRTNSEGMLLLTNREPLNYNGQEITADRLQVNQMTGELSAEGNVRVETTNGLMAGDKFVGNIRTNGGRAGGGFWLSSLKTVRSSQIEKPGVSNNVGNPTEASEDYLAHRSKKADEVPLPGGVIRSATSYEREWFYYRHAPGGDRKDRQAFLQKLDQIRLDNYSCDNLPLKDVLRRLFEEARHRDPAQEGVNLAIAGPLLGKPPVAEVASIPITISPEHREASLATILYAVVKGAAIPIDYSIRDNDVVFYLKRDAAEGATSKTGSAVTNQPRAGTSTAESFLRLIGMNGSSLDGRNLPYLQWLRAGDSARQSPDSAAQRGRTGVTLTSGNSTVTIDPYNQLGMNSWIVEGQNLLYQQWFWYRVGKTNESKLGQQPEPQISIKTRFVEVPASQLEAFVLDLVAAVKPADAQNWAGVLTEPQMNQVLQRLEMNKGISLLSDGEVTTVSGRQAQLQTVEIKTIVTDINPKALVPPGITSTNKGGSGESLFITTNLSFGQTIDIVPTITPDGYSVAMTVIPQMTEFLGYDGVEHPTNSVAVYENGKKGKATYPSPRFRTQQMTNNTVVRDGMTLVLGTPPVARTTRFKDKIPFLGAIPGIGRLFRTESSQNRTNVLLIFVTPTIVDPAAQPIHGAASTNSPAR